MRNGRGGLKVNLLDWTRLARPHFLVPGFMLFVLGWGLALIDSHDLDIGRFIMGYVVFALAQLSANIGNDYFDRESDRKGIQTSVSGGSGVLVRRPELSETALKVTLVLLASSLALGAILTYLTNFGPGYYAFIVFGALLGFFYSAPPLRLAYRGMGEITTAIAVGLVMPGMGY